MGHWPDDRCFRRIVSPDRTNRAGGDNRTLVGHEMFGKTPQGLLGAVRLGCGLPAWEVPLDAGFLVPTFM
ncbi:MAG: hypothetical protein WB630_03305 [Candidatus Acidiferrales bacterium]